MLGNSAAVVFVRTRPRAIPLAMITMRKSTHGFPFLSYMSMGLRLAAPGAPLKQHITVQCSAVQCSAVQCSAVQYSAVQYSAVQYSAVHICYLPAGRSVWWKTVTEALKMLPEAAGRGRHFQARGHSFSLYGPTLSRQITCLFFFSWSKLVLQITNGFVYATLVIESACAPSTKDLKKNLGNERVTQIVDKERCIKEQIFSELLCASCIYCTS